MASPNLKRLAFVLSILKILGLCPLTWDHTRRQFMCNFFTRGIIASLAMALIASFIHVIYITHTVFRYNYLLGPGIYYTYNMLEEVVRNSSHLSQNEKDINLSCFRALIGLSSFQFFIYLSASLINCNALPRLLNNWNELEVKLFKLAHAWSTAEDTKHKVFRHNALVFFALLVSIIPASMSAARNQQHPDYLLEVSVNFIIWAYFGSMETLHEMIVILTLKELRNNFVQVHQGLATLSVKQSCLTPENVDQLSDMAVAIRQHGRLLRNYLAPAQLPSLLSTMIFCVLFIFSSLLILSGSSLGEGEDSSVANVHLVIAFFLFLRLYNKCCLAQNVTNEEENLALELTRLGLKSSPLVAQKVKMLVDIMIQKPCEVSLGSMVTLRKPLVLGAISQIATYLIVVTQFYNSK